jgi:hypothetical protein
MPVHGKRTGAIAVALGVGYRLERLQSLFRQAVRLATHRRGDALTCSLSGIGCGGMNTDRSNRGRCEDDQGQS